MPRTRSQNLTDAELRLMEALWRIGSGTVTDVADELHTTLAYSSILTTLRILEKKKYLTHEKQGRAFVYRPIVGRHEARQNAIAHLLHRFFENSPELLMLNLIGDGKVKADELARITARIEGSKK